MSDYTPEQMRKVAGELAEFLTGGVCETVASSMLRQGADAIEALTAKEQEIARLTERIDDLLNCLSWACPYEKRMKVAEAALTTERQKVRELREWHRVNVQESRMAGSVAALTSAEESARFLGEVQAHNDSLSKLDALALTGSEPQ